MNTRINFGGFYESLHDHKVEEAVAHDFDMLDEDYEVDTEKTWYIGSDIWQDARLKYVQDYIDVFNATFGTSLEFREISSPREYNFSTDVIYADFSRKDFLILMKQLKEDNANLKQRLYQKLREVSTSYDGYMAFFDYEDYFKAENRGLLMECLIDVLLERESEDYPVYVEGFYYEAPETETDEKGYISLKGE